MGGVPITVVKPPRAEPNAIGISKIDGDRLVSRADCKAIGIIRANAPTLFINAERRALIKVNAATCITGNRVILLSTVLTALRIPESVIVWEMIITQATVMTAGLLRPE